MKTKKAVGMGELTLEMIGTNGFRGSLICALRNEVFAHGWVVPQWRGKRGCIRRAGDEPRKYSSTTLFSRYCNCWNIIIVVLRT